MKVTVQNLILDKDMVAKPNPQVWLWEVPLLQAKHGEGKVRLQDTAEIEVDGLPDVAEVYSGLMRKYGVDGGEGGTNIPYVDIAYGRGKSGKAALEKEIAKSAQRKRKVTKKAAAKKPEPAPVKAAVDGDAAYGGEGDPLNMV
jgi:hypothetical protein